MTPHVSINQVSKVYFPSRGQPVQAIESVTFDVAHSEFVVIVGRSGCGKSTLLKMIANLEAPTSGQVTVHPHGHAAPRELGVVFQSAVLLKWRTVIDNVMLPIELLGLPRAEYRDRAQALLELTHLQEFARRYPRELSGGMQQRVSLCRALVHDPKLLLMDEPFVALDALTREELGYELERIWERTKKTVVFVTHGIPEAVFLADRVVVLAERPSHVRDIVEIDLPRPRTPELKASARFAEFVEHIHGLLGIGWLPAGAAS